jgi:hypothetical protein
VDAVGCLSTYRVWLTLFATRCIAAMAQTEDPADLTCITPGRSIRWVHADDGISVILSIESKVPGSDPCVGGGRENDVGERPQLGSRCERGSLNGMALVLPLSFRLNIADNSSQIRKRFPKLQPVLRTSPLFFLEAVISSRGGLHPRDHCVSMFHPVKHSS